MNALMFLLLVRFWRQLVFALLTCWACQIWFGGSTAVIATSGIGGFAFAESLFLLDRWRRIRRGLPPPSRLAIAGSAIALCIAPGAVFGLGFAAGRHFPADTAAAHGLQKRPRPPRTRGQVKDVPDAARDADLVVTVFDIERAARVRTVSGPTLTPVTGDALIVADLLVATVDDPADPFCRRGYGALLVDIRGRRFETVAGENAVRGIDGDFIKGGLVCTLLPPRSVDNQRLVFQVPATDRVAGLAVWDRQEAGDPRGRTYAYFRAFKNLAVPDLGAAAWGPARVR